MCLLVLLSKNWPFFYFYIFLELSGIINVMTCDHQSLMSSVVKKSKNKIM